MPVVPGLLLSVRSEEGHAALDVPTRRATGESSTDGALVATTTRKPPARKTTTAKKTSTSKKSSASRGRSSGRGGGSKRPPSLIGRMWTATREHVGSQSNDLYGLLLILLGVISALALYADAAGPVGAFLEATWRGLFGVFGGVMPIVLLFFGGLVVFDRPAPVVGRVAVGTFLTGLALFGSWHLLAGHPHPSEGLREVWSGGGVVGWAVATPLEAGLVGVGGPRRVRGRAGARSPDRDGHATGARPDRDPHLADDRPVAGGGAGRRHAGAHEAGDRKPSQAEGRPDDDDQPLATATVPRWLPPRPCRNPWTVSSRTTA
jgi:hypothetical protein